MSACRTTRTMGRRAHGDIRSTTTRVHLHAVSQDTPAS
jgi:hypothetical protein